MVKKTPAYKNRLRALELERSGGTTNKKKTHRQMNKYELMGMFFDRSNKIAIDVNLLLWIRSTNVDPSPFQNLPGFCFRIILWLHPNIGLSIQ